MIEHNIVNQIINNGQRYDFKYQYRTHFADIIQFKISIPKYVKYIDYEGKKDYYNISEL